MFTGIIETIGFVAAAEPMDRGRRLSITVPWSDTLSRGDSVAVDGVCLTVVGSTDDTFFVEAVEETVARTIIGSYAEGTRVHLERALKVGDRLGGHFVQGHVDAVGRVASIEERGENRYLSVEIPVSGRRFVAPRGSIAINGVSLTILSIEIDSVVQISIVPHTWNATTFSAMQPEDHANVEYDIVARYVQRLTEVAE